MLKENLVLKRQLKQFIVPDKVEAMERETMKGTRWKEATIEKSLKITTFLLFKRLQCCQRNRRTVDYREDPPEASRGVQVPSQNTSGHPSCAS